METQENPKRCPLDDELISAIARELDIPHKKAKKVLQTVIQVMTYKLIKLGVMKLRGFGVFSAVTRKSHRHYNPQTGVSEIKPISKVISFKPSRKIRDDINRRTHDQLRADKGV